MSIILAIVAAAIALVLVLAAMKPDRFRVERATSIDAPPEKVFALINDFRNWGVWSPWEKLDPALQRSYSGPASGTGAVYAWSGNGKAGQGRMEIAAAAPPSRLTIRIDFLRPMKASNIVEFSLEAQGQTTRVSWAMHGDAPFVARIFHVFFNMDRLVGKDFEAGLASMKSAAEA